MTPAEQGLLWGWQAVIPEAGTSQMVPLLALLAAVLLGFLARSKLLSNVQDEAPGKAKGALPAPTGAPTAPPVPGGSTADADGKQPTKQPSPAAGTPHPEGYRAQVEELRREEFGRLHGRVYADYAGAAPFSERLLAEVVRELSSSLHGNPHSEAGWGESRSAAADAARLLTLRACRADPEHYTCIFTAGATAALKLVGESFPWSPSSSFLYLQDNHNSVLGIRQLAAQHGAACTAAVRVETRPGCATSAGRWQLAPCGDAAAAGLAAACVAASSGSSDASEDPPQHLFAFPLESNFSGVRYDPALVAAVQAGTLWVRDGASCPADGGQHISSSSGGSGGGSAASLDGAAAGTACLPPGRWRVLLDCAKACASSPPDLAAHPADFVVLSYYKMFGYPTGLGALIVRKDALACLRRRYFGGGTVAVSLSDEPFHRLRPGPAGWEDGTPAFLDFPAVTAGFQFIERLGGFAAVAGHGTAVAASLARQISVLRHANGTPVCVLYGVHDVAAQQAQHAQGQQRAQQADVGLLSAASLPAGVCGQGPVVAFNLLRADGSFVGYREVEKLASLCSIHLRTGCLCNPGACAAALGLTSADLRANFEAGHVCWDDRDVIHGRPTGVVRASFGYASSLGDAAAIADFVRRFFVEGAEGQTQSQGGREGLELAPAAAGAGAAWPGEAAGAAGGSSEAQRAPAAAAEASEARNAACAAATAPWPPAAAAQPAGQPPALDAEAAASGRGRIDSLWVYPIKSCRGFSPAAWPLGPAGLLYDRHWALVDAGTGATLRLKKHPALATVSTQIDLRRRLLLVSAAGEAAELAIPLPGAEATMASSSTHGEGSRHSGDGDTQISRSSAAFPVSVCTRTACMEQCASATGGEAEVAAWFTRVLGVPCRLVQVAAAGAGAAGARQAPAGSDRSTGSSQASGPDSDSVSSPASSSSGSGSGSQSFANEGHFLVVGSASLADLAARSASAEPAEVFLQRFRPNLVIGGTEAYAEDSWRQLTVHATSAPADAPAAMGQSSGGGSTHRVSCSGSHAARCLGEAVQPLPPQQHSARSCEAAGAGTIEGPVWPGRPEPGTTAGPQRAAAPSAVVQLHSVGPCTRCDMVCADPLTGRRIGPEPLLTLAGYRRTRGRITFGLLANCCTREGATAALAEPCPQSGQGQWQQQQAGEDAQGSAQHPVAPQQRQQRQRWRGELHAQQHAEPVWVAVGMAVCPHL